MEKKLHGNYTRMLRTILNKSWRQHSTKQQLYGHQPTITKTVKIRRTKHAEHCWRSKDEFIRDVLLWNPSDGCAKQDVQLCADTRFSPKYQSEAIGRGGERESCISALIAQHDDGDYENAYRKGKNARIKDKRENYTTPENTPIRHHPELLQVNNMLIINVRDEKIWEEIYHSSESRGQFPLGKNVTKELEEQVIYNI